MRESRVERSGPLVRRARPEDGPRIIDLDRELARFVKLRPPDDVETGRLLSWIFESQRLEALVAELDGMVEGVALFYEGLGTFRAKPFLYLEDLVISEPARSRGIGEALMAALAREAVSRGALRVEWAVLDWNERAMRFYERLGARRPHEWIKFALEGEALETQARSPDHPITRSPDS
jgi:GNAT superfamily N-acetyltransferase